MGGPAMPYLLIPQTLVRRERWPGGNWLQASALVEPGQEVIPDQPVMRLLRSSQPVMDSGPFPSAPQRSGPLAGSLRNAETIPAGISGRVVDLTPRGGVVIEAQASLLSGAIGAGRQVAGVLTIWNPEQSVRKRNVIPPGAILVVSGSVDLALLSQALRSEVAGIVAGSISLRDFEGFLRTDLIQLISSSDVERSQAYLPPLTLLLTEGVGSFAMPEYIFALLSRRHGSIALLSGATSVPLGIFPELVISLSSQDVEPVEAVQPVSLLEPGALVRVCGGDHLGVLGIIDYLFAYQQTFPSGVRSRAVRLYLDDGTHLIVPLFLLERVG
jgi:hypothetical protein